MSRYHQIDWLENPSKRPVPINWPAWLMAGLLVAVVAVIFFGAALVRFQP